MPETNTTCATKQAATRAVAAMTRPEGMTRATWTSVHALLREIARSYPKAYPSQLTLAARTGIPVRSVRRYVAAAVTANLLVVTPREGAEPKRLMGSRTNRYWIVDPDHEARLASDHEAKVDREEIRSYSVGATETPSLKTSSSDPSPCSPFGLAVPSGGGKPSTVVGMFDRGDREHYGDGDGERDVSARTIPSLRRSKNPPPRRPDADAIVTPIISGRRGHRRTPKPPTQSRRLAEYFGLVWQQMQLETGLYKDKRGLETVGQAKTYIEAHFATLSELEVRKKMDEFVVAVSKGHVSLKPGQSAWMCFTGAWGRQRHVDTGDIYAAYRRKPDGPA